MRLKPPDQLTTALLWLSAIFMATKEGVEQWPAASKALPQMSAGWTGFVPIGLLVAAGLVTLARALRPTKLSNEGVPQVQLSPGWEDKLEQVVGRSFSNCEVRLDNKQFQHCSFDHVTFIYNGGAVSLKDNKIGPHNFKFEKEEINRTINILILFGHFSSQIITESGPISLGDLRARGGNKAS